MTTEELKREHAYRYNERLGIMEVWGVPSAFEHNTAVSEADECIRKLRGSGGFLSKTEIAAKLKQIREGL